MQAASIDIYIRVYMDLAEADYSGSERDNVTGIRGFVHILDIPPLSRQQKLCVSAQSRLNLPLRALYLNWGACQERHTA